MPDCGRVYFVGAGPGNPGLITVRGTECLRRADAVLYDYLANARLLAYVRPEAELICLGQHRRSDVWPQKKINEELVKRARAGECVVRLKGGDPLVFGRAAEELDAVSTAGIDFEIVPGVTTASAAGAYAGVTITDRGFASAVALVTGHERMGKPDSAIDYQSLANFPGTLVFYMGVSTVETWSSALLAAGKSADTPVLVIRRCSWPDQLTLPCKLGELADMLTPYSKVPPPAVIIVGQAAQPHARFDWYAKLPLLGQRIIVTRPQCQADTMMRQLETLGANVICQPAVEISPPDSWQQVDAAIDRLQEVDHIVFSSSNGVQFFLDRLLARGDDVRRLAGARLAVVGAATADALADYHLRADQQPTTFRAEALLEELLPEANGKRVLLIRASRGRDILAKRLTEGGADVQEVVAYKHEDVDQLRDATLEFLAAGKVDWITATSSAIARSVCQLFAAHIDDMSIASISPLTSQTIRECGVEPAAEAVEYTAAGVVDAIVQKCDS